MAVLGVEFFLQEWWDNPEAAVTLVVASVGGLVALWRLRVIPKERRRENLLAMRSDYHSTQAARAVVLPKFPPLVPLGHDELLSAATATAGAQEGSQGPKDHARAIQRECSAWTDPSHTNAAEYLENEAKFRSLLWAIGVIRDPDGSRTNRTEPKLTSDVLKHARELVNSLNDFAQFFENGVYDQHSVLAQFHRSIVPTVRLVEPLIWAAAISGRWGLRVLRLGIRAEHYNDVNRIHATSDVLLRTTWRSQVAETYVVHRARLTDQYGRVALVGARWRLVSVARWYTLSLPVRLVHRYGGSRLRAHRRSEEQLRALLRRAVEVQVDPLEFDWSLTGLRHDLREAQLGRTVPRPLAPVTTTS
jgi:hypothetical protein